MTKQYLLYVLEVCQNTVIYSCINCVEDSSFDMDNVKFSKFMISSWMEL
jgi:hypothetical protein